MKVLTASTTEHSFDLSSPELAHDTYHSELQTSSDSVYTCFQCSEEGFTEVATCFCEDCKLEASLRMTAPNNNNNHNNLHHSSSSKDASSSPHPSSSCCDYYFCSYHGVRHAKSHPHHGVTSLHNKSTTNQIEVIHSASETNSSFNTNLSNNHNGWMVHSFFSNNGSNCGCSFSSHSTEDGSSQNIPSHNNNNNHHSLFNDQDLSFSPSISYSIPPRLFQSHPHLHNNNNTIPNTPPHHRHHWPENQYSMISPRHYFGFPMCNEHHIPINTYCRTCEKLICSVCALVKSHTGHMFDLIQEVESRERQEIQENLQVIKQEIEHWEDEFQTSESDLEKTITRIDEMQLKLSNKVQSVVDELKKKLDEHSRIIKNNIEEVCEEQKNVVHSIKNLKKQITDLLSEFDHLEEMSGFDLIEKKLSRVSSIYALCERMKKEFPYESTRQLYDMKIDIDPQSVKAACEQIEQLSHIVKIEPMCMNEHSNVPDSMEEEKKQTLISMKQPLSLLSIKDGRFNYESVEFIGNASKGAFSKVPLKCPTDVAISYLHSCIVVSEWGQQQIHLFDLFSKQHKYVFSMPSAPRNLAVDPNITQYLSIVVSASDNLVYKYNIVIPHVSPVSASNLSTMNHHIPTILSKDRKTATNYDHMLVWISGKQMYSPSESHKLFKYPRGIAVEKAIRNLSNNYEIYVCDHGNHRIIVLNSVDGSFLRTIGGSSLYVHMNDSTISFSRDASLTLSLDDLSSSNNDTNASNVQKFKRPWGITIYKNKYLIISEKRGNRIQVLTKEGEFIAEFPSRQEQELSMNNSVKILKPRGLLVDPSNKNNVLIVDGGNHRLVLCDIRTGQVLSLFGNLGHDMNQFNEPHGICLNELTGEIYVADCNNHCIHVLGPKV